jgi:hypothetical protein
MSKELKNLIDSLSKAKAEAQALMTNPSATADEINAKAAEIKAINAKIELQRQDEGGTADGCTDGDGTDGGIGDETYVQNIAAIKKQYPGVLDTLENSVKTAERQRIKDIDAIAGQVAPALVAKAKYDQPITAKDLAFEQMKGQKAKGNQFLQGFADDTLNSHVKDVGAAINDLPDATDNQQRASFGKKLHDSINRKLGR